MKIKKVIIISMLAFILTALVPLVAAVAVGETAPAGEAKTVYVSLDNPLGNVKTPQQLVGKIINAVMGIVGSASLLMFVYGGLLWMTSAGSADKVSKGKNILLWSALGLVVIFTSYALVKFVLETIGA